MTINLAFPHLDPADRDWALTRRLVFVHRRTNYQHIYLPLYIKKKAQMPTYKSESLNDPEMMEMIVVISKQGPPKSWTKY